MDIVVRVVAAMVMTLTAGACAGSPVCPQTLAQAEAGDFDARAESTLVATGVAIRFVPSPELESRGYDLAVDRLLWGNRPEVSTFLRVPNEIVDVRPGAPVLIVAEPTEKGWVITQGTCVALRPIAESEGDRPASVLRVGSAQH
jgi:hypothetical protein